MNPGGDERAVADVVTDLHRELDLPAPERLALEPHRPNLLSTVDFGSGGRHLVLCGHLDTKPIGDARWKVDPLAADIDGDRLYGLGSCDMKAGIAAILVATHQMVTSAGPTVGRLTLLFTADEEAGAAYGGYFLSRSGVLNADAMVIAEPAGLQGDFDALHLVSRGSARIHVTATGLQGHSSLADAETSTPRDADAPRRQPEDNAGVLAARAVCAIADGGSIQAPENPFELVGWQTTLNAGLAYRGGVGFGVLPGEITAVTEVRTVPGMHRDDVVAEIRRRVSAVDEDNRIGVEYDTEPLDWLQPTMVAAEDPIAVAAGNACASTFGVTPPLSVFPGTTDATWFGATGGIPTLPAFGPGLLRRAHGADEWVSIAATRKAVGLYRELVHRFCDPSNRSDTAQVSGRPDA